MEDYVQLMKKTTKEAHSLSDSLINAKLALAISNDKVWSDGLLIFYEIFKFIENAIKKSDNPHLTEFNMKELFRTETFENDLDFYLGPDWKKNYIPRKAVRRYINYLEKLERNEPELLIAYIYHLYMGLLSGGQLLKKKRQLQSKIFGNDMQLPGFSVTHFSKPILELKELIRTKTNKIVGQLNDDMKQKIINEGKMVFHLNNEIVRTIEGTYPVLFKKLCILLTGLTVSYFIIKYLIK